MGMGETDGYWHDVMFIVVVALKYRARHNISPQSS